MILNLDYLGYIAWLAEDRLYISYIFGCEVYPSENGLGATDRTASRSENQARRIPTSTDCRCHSKFSVECGVHPYIYKQVNLSTHLQAYVAYCNNIIWGSMGKDPRTYS